jgi:hypothetical protein
VPPREQGPYGCVRCGKAVEVAGIRGKTIDKYARREVLLPACRDRRIDDHLAEIGIGCDLQAQPDRISGRHRRNHPRPEHYGVRLRVRRCNTLWKRELPPRARQGRRTQPSDRNGGSDKAAAHGDKALEELPSCRDSIRSSCKVWTTHEVDSVLGARQRTPGRREVSHRWHSPREYYITKLIKQTLAIGV